MAVIVQDCPHCATKRVSFVVRWAEKGFGDSLKWAGLAVCGACNRPIAFELDAAVEGFSLDRAGPRIPTDDSAQVVRFVAYPQPTPDDFPAHLPVSVGASFREALAAFDTGVAPTLAVMGFRRALDLAVKDKFPEGVGLLGVRLRKMAEKHVVPTALADWMEHLKDLGNGAAHDPEVFSRGDAAALRELTRYVLLYLYTLPEQVRIARGQPGAAA